MRNYSIPLVISFITLLSCSKPTDEEQKQIIPIDTNNKFVGITPSGNTSTLTSIWFFDALTGTITTSSNQILNTIDGGTTYLNSTIYGSNYLENLYFFNSSIGFCTDPNFKTFKYNEPNWSEFNFPVKDTYASSFQMLSETQIFATTIKGENTLSYLVNSINGGAIWDTLFEYDANFKEILMLDENTGFLLVNGDNKINIIKTSDGGKSWYSRLPQTGSNFPENAQLKKILAIDNNNLIAIGRGSATNQGFILTSVDGGDIWKLASIDHALTSACITENDVFFAGAELFVAQWKINTLEMVNPIEITDSWKIFNRETDFLVSEKGEPVTHYHHVIQVQFIDTTTGFLLTADASELFKITLVP